MWTSKYMKNLTLGKINNFWSIWAFANQMSYEWYVHLALKNSPLKNIHTAFLQLFILKCLYPLLCPLPSPPRWMPFIFLFTRKTYIIVYSLIILDFFFPFYKIVNEFREIKLLHQNLVCKRLMQPRTRNMTL